MGRGQLGGGQGRGTQLQHIVGGRLTTEGPAPQNRASTYMRKTGHALFQSAWPHRKLGPAPPRVPAVGSIPLMV